MGHGVKLRTLHTHRHRWAKLTGGHHSLMQLGQIGARNASNSKQQLSCRPHRQPTCPNSNRNSTSCPSGRGYLASCLQSPGSPTLVLLCFVWACKLYQFAELGKRVYQGACSPRAWEGIKRETPTGVVPLNYGPSQSDICQLGCANAEGG